MSICHQKGSMGDIPTKYTQCCIRHDNVDVTFSAQFRCLTHDNFCIVMDMYECKTYFKIRNSFEEDYKIFYTANYVHPVTPETFHYWMNKMKTLLVFS